MLTQNKSAISFDVTEEQVKAIQASAEQTDETADDIAVDVVAFSAYNCAWMPPVTKDQK